jgi:hypothetical protein
VRIAAIVYLRAGARTQNRTCSVVLRMYRPGPIWSLHHVSSCFGTNPHARATAAADPSITKAFGAHSHRCAPSAASSVTRIAQIRSNDIVA